MGLFGGLGNALGSFVGLGDLGEAVGGIGDYFLNKHDERDAASRANKYALYFSNTAHQREVADLRAAGLNPVLSAMGSGASSPTIPVNAPTNDQSGYEQARHNRRMEALGEAASARAVEKLQAEIDNINADTKAKESQWNWGKIFPPEAVRGVLSGILNDGFSLDNLGEYIRGAMGLPGRPMSVDGVSSARFLTPYARTYWTAIKEGKSDREAHNEARAVETEKAKRKGTKSASVWDYLERTGGLLTPVL